MTGDVFDFPNKISRGRRRRRRRPGARKLFDAAPVLFSERVAPELRWSSPLSRSLVCDIEASCDRSEFSASLKNKYRKKKKKYRACISRLSIARVIYLFLYNISQFSHVSEIHRKVSQKYGTTAFFFFTEFYTVEFYAENL